MFILVADKAYNDLWSLIFDDR